MSEFSVGGTVLARYTYDALGQQVIRELVPEGKRIHAIHDLEGNRIAEYEYDAASGVSTLLREYIWMSGEPVAVVEAGNIYFIRTDHIGRPVFATDVSAAKVWEATYLPFGGVHVVTGDPIELRFPGQWFQLESGLHQNWMRDYDPTLGRYIQADPLGLIPGPSLYGYAHQSPMMYIDPDGENPFLAAVLAGALIGMAFDFAVDMTFGDKCYTWAEALQSAALGAGFSGAGLAAKGVKRAGKEFSHAVPSRWLKKTRFGRWLDRKGNPYRSLNGNYVSPMTHAMTDYHRRVKGIPANKMYNPVRRYAQRVPLWSYGGFFGALSVNGIGCGCETNE